MSRHSLDKLPWDSDQLNLRKEAQATLTAYKAFLANPAFTHRVDLAVLTKIAADEKLPARDRRRAAEILGKLHMQAMAKVAELSCVREQVLDQLGLSGAAQPVAVTQVNTKVEIVRQDDWRAASVEASPTPEAGDEPAG